MDSEVKDGFVEYSEPKDIKRSLRNKYNVRLRHLRHSIQQFLEFSEQRLDDANGKIYRRDVSLAIHKKSEELLNMLPVEKEYLPTQEDCDLFIENLLNASEETERIMKEAAEWTAKFDLQSFQKQMEEINNEIRKIDNGLTTVVADGADIS